MSILNESIYISVWSWYQVRGELYPISVYSDVAQVDMDNPDYFVEPMEGNLLDEAYVLNYYFDQLTEIIMWLMLMAWIYLVNKNLFKPIGYVKHLYDKKITF